MFLKIILKNGYQKNENLTQKKIKSEDYSNEFIRRNKIKWKNKARDKTLINIIQIINFIHINDDNVYSNLIICDRINKKKKIKLKSCECSLIKNILLFFLAKSLQFKTNLKANIEKLKFNCNKKTNNDDVNKFFMFFFDRYSYKMLLIYKN